MNALRKLSAALPLLLACLHAAMCRGQELLRQPLDFVPAASVVFLDPDEANLTATGLAADPALLPRPYPELSRREARRQLRAGWRADRGGDVYSAVADINRLAPLLRWTGCGTVASDIGFLLYRRVLPAAQAEGFPRHMAAQALVSAGGLAYMARGADVYVNLLANSMARVRTGALDFTLDQITTMPYGGSVRFRISGVPTMAQLVLHILLPDGAAAPPTVYVNGRSEACPVQDGYIVVRRPWNSGDEVWFELENTEGYGR